MTLLHSRFITTSYSVLIDNSPLTRLCPMQDKHPGSICIAKWYSGASFAPEAHLIERVLPVHRLSAIFHIYPCYGPLMESDGHLNIRFSDKNYWKVGLAPVRLYQLKFLHICLPFVIRSFSRYNFALLLILWHEQIATLSSL